MQFSPWIFVSLAAPAFALPLAVFAYRRRHAAGAVPMAVLGLVIAWWGFFQALETTATTLEWTVFLSTIQYLGVATAPLVWLWFALDYTGYKRFVSPWGAAALAAIPAATLVVAFTNGLHGLLWRSITLLPGELVTTVTEYGPWFPVMRWYAYAMTVAATALLAWYVARGREPYPRLAAVIGAPAVVLALNALYLSPLQPPQWVDLTPAGFAVGCVLLGWVLLGSGLLDLPPVARARVMEHLREGVAVVDPSGRLLDLNGAGRRLLGAAPGDALPEPLRRHVARIREDGAGADRETSPPLVQHDPGTGERLLELTVSSWGATGSSWTLMVVRDATERTRMQRRLEAANAALQRANSELATIARTDGLTGLANRSYLLEILHGEILRSTRSGRPVSLIVVDIDHFKAVNDRHGHLVGDEVLRCTASHIRDAVRQIDTPGRIGGEEFAVVLPEADREGARLVAERVRAAVEAQRVTVRAEAVRVTCSAGAAELASGMPADELIRSADAAMYRAKLAGRNRVEVCDGAAPREG